MRGAKRPAISETNPFSGSTDSFMQSKKAMIGSPFGAQRTEAGISPPPLDMQRAESSKQHVRALNTQFASWVQDQLKNHPDELWEDGVQDYLNHAKSIMDKFNDVVNWLKAHAAKGESNEPWSNDAPIKPMSEIEKTGPKMFSDKPVFPVAPTPSFGSAAPTPSFGSAATTPSFGSSWSPKPLFNNNAPFSFGGSQISAPGNAVPSNDLTSIEADGEDDVEQPSSPSVKKSEQKGIITVHEVKCKLYVKSNDPGDKDAWKDKGMGQLNIKCKEGFSKGTKESKPTIVIRNDVGRVLLNALIYPGIKTNLQKNSVVAIFHTSADGEDNNNVVARTFLMRTKTLEDRDKLAAVIQEYAPAP